MAKVYSGAPKVRLILNALKGRPMTVAQCSEITGLHYETTRRILNELNEKQVVNKTYHNAKHIVFSIEDEHKKRTIPPAPDGSMSMLKMYSVQSKYKNQINKSVADVLGKAFSLAKKKYLGHNIEPDLRMAKRDMDAKIKILRKEIDILVFLRDDPLLWNETAMETWPSDPDWPKYESEIPND